MSIPIHWVGRTYETPIGTHCGFPGVYCVIEGQFEMARVRIHSTSNDVYVRIGLDDDFSNKVRLSSGANVLKLINEPFDGQITLFRCTEAWQGTIDIDGFEVTGITRQPKRKPHRLMFIGDSITCGAGVLLKEGFVSNDSFTNDAYHSFGIELGRRLNAEVHLVSYGGRGLYRDWQGFTSDKINNAPDFFERATPDDAKAVWDHQRYQPEAIVIALGTNDFNQGIVPEDIWIPKYLQFLKRVREVHPDAKIFLQNSPMHGEGTYRETLIRYLKEIISRFADNKVSFAEVDYHKGSAVDAHPDLGQHLLMADQLEPILSRSLQ